jgi:hypothetical protein
MAALALRVTFDGILGMHVVHFQMSHSPNLTCSECILAVFGTSQMSIGQLDKFL